MKTCKPFIHSIIFALIFIINSELSLAQIGIGTTNPDTSSKLDVFSSSKGFLPPRMTKTQRDDINGGVFAEGLVIYNTDDNCLNFYNGTIWVNPCDNSGGTTPPNLPGNITLTAGQKLFIGSIYDNNYLPYIKPTIAADTGSLDANLNTDVTIDVQGIVTTSGIKVEIPYTVSTAAVDLPAFSQTRTVISDHVQGANPASNKGGGTPIDLIFSYEAATLAPGSGIITATIKAVDNDLNAVKLDINKGIGIDFGILLAEFSIATDNNGNTGTVELRNIAGIPDRRMGQQTKTGATNLTDGTLGFNHNNLYLPIKTTNGRVWLNNNLGANYSDFSFSGFNLTKQAGSDQDENAYGSMYQWGRYSDGHELITYASSSTGTSDNGTTTTLSTNDNPNHSLFIINLTTTPFDWKDSRNNLLWQGVDGLNNPCPEGYRVPSVQEYKDFVNSETISNATELINSNLKFTRTGERSITGGIASEGIDLLTWTSGTVTSSVGYAQMIQSIGGVLSTNAEHQRGRALSIRCIQHAEVTTPIPTNMVLTGNKISYVASIEDNDYLPYTIPTGPANQQTSGDGTADDTQINVQGVLTTTGQTISIPFTVTGSVNYNAYSYTVNVHDSLTEDGIGRQVNFSYPGGSTSSNGSIIMTIKSVGGDLNLKKLDLNNGLGDGTSTEGHINANAFGVLVAEVPILINDANDTNYIQLRNTSGIPDRRFGETTTQGNPGVAGQYHNNLYLPVVAEDGRLWLNHELGAIYTRMNQPDGLTANPDFNPAAIPNDLEDYKAYGNHFQFGRYADGHELVTFSSTPSGNSYSDASFNFTNLPKSSSETTTDKTLTSNQFVLAFSTGIWHNNTTVNEQLWTGINAPNNPCPFGFRVPSNDDYQTLRQSINWGVAGTNLEKADFFENNLEIKFVYHGSMGANGKIFGGYSNRLTGYVFAGISDDSPTFVNGGGNIYISAGNYWPAIASSPSANQKASGYPIRCIQHVEAPTPIPSNMTLTGNNISYVASINDNDYLPYTTPTGPANQQTSGDGSADDSQINVQGILSTTGQTVSIPYTVSGSVNYNAYSYTVAVHDSLTEDGNGGQVNFSYPAGSTSTNGSITMTIKSVGGDLNLKKLDLNNGLGDGSSIEGHLNSNVYGVLVAEVPILINDANDTNYIQLRNISGIPDRRFGETTTQGNPGVAGQYHNNLYLPITLSDGSIWLNNNLGANYSKPSFPGFNILNQTTSHDDENAYGSLYQWGRYSDGHELMTYSNNNTGVSVNGSSSDPNSLSQPTTNKFILQSTEPRDWKTGGDNNLWQGETGENNPCPRGFRIPTHNEIVNMFSSAGITNRTNAASSIMKLTTSGFRLYNGGVELNAGSDGYLWSSTISSGNTNFYTSNGQYAKNRRFNLNNGLNDFEVQRANSYAIRCIQHVDAPSPIPSSMTLVGDRVSYTGSIVDADYIPYTPATAPAKLAVKAADGATSETAIDITGVLTTTGKTITIPYTSTGTPNYDGYSYTVSVHDSLTEDGLGRDVNFSYPAGTAISPEGSITMTIKSIGGDLNFKKLDINNGIGDGTTIEGSITSNVYGVFAAEVPIYIDAANTLKHIQLRFIAGIPDRRFGTPTTNTLSDWAPYPTDYYNGEYHNLLYVPIADDEGNVWLNNNLGSNYNNINSPEFNPTKQAQNKADLNAVGYLFQWGRKPDGHEIVIWKESTNVANKSISQFCERTNSGTPNNFPLADTSNTDGVFRVQPPTNSTGDHPSYTWIQGTNSTTTLWKTESHPNNPCPEGFKVPSLNKIGSFIASETISNSDDLFDSSLKMPAFTGTVGSSQEYYEIINSSAYETVNFVSSDAIGYVSNEIPHHQANSYRITNASVSNTVIRYSQGNPIRCIQDTEEPSSIPANMTLSGNKVSYIASINDNDYLPYSTPTGPANQQSSGDGSADDNQINVQGTLTTTGQTLSIPFTVSGSVNYDAYSYTVTVHDSLTEDGIGRQVNFSYPAGSASSNGSITMTIKSIDGPLNLKKLDLNNGLGDGTSIEGHINSDVLGVLVAEVPIYVNSTPNTEYIQLRNISGIPDRMFGQASVDGGTEEHDFLYIPVQAEDGNIWLNNNLGAAYADIHSANFNIAQQMTSFNDNASKGSLFQWGRKPDGHELTNRTSTPTQTIHSYTFTRNNNPNHALVIKATNNPYDWRTSSNNNLWNGVNSPNNPCPDGYRVPTSAELSGYFSIAGIIDSTSNLASALKFPYAGFAVDGYSSSIISAENGTDGYYWSTTYGTDHGQSTPEQRAYCWQFISISNWQRVFLERKGYSMSVRCILD